MTTTTDDAWIVPDYVPAELVHPLNHWNSPEFIADPVGYWDGVRDQFRVFWSPLLGGFWCLTRYEDVHRAYQQTHIFSSTAGVAIPPRPIRLLPLTLDPPDHATYRRLLNSSFSPTRIAQLSGDVRVKCIELVEDIKAAGSCDFMEAFARPLPTQIFCRLLGLPPEELGTFLAWNDVLLHVSGDAESRARAAAVNEELNAYLNELIAFRKHHPDDDIITFLLASTVDGHPLTDMEALQMTYLLFIAGLDTVTAALGWIWQFLADQPAHRRQIVEDPALIPNAVEELLRFYSFIMPVRTVMVDCEFAGVSMHQGDRIMFPTGAAARDSAQFPDPYDVDFRREPNRHIAFGAGPHRCAGSHLARAELRIAVEEWHRRIPDYQIPSGVEIKYHGGAVVGADVLPLEILPS